MTYWFRSDYGIIIPNHVQKVLRPTSSKPKTNKSVTRRQSNDQVTYVKINPNLDKEQLY